MKKNNYLEYLSKLHSKRNNKRGIKTLLNKRTISSIYIRTVRIERIIGSDLDKHLDGSKNSVDNLFLKFNSRLKNINHIKVYRSAVNHYNDCIAIKKLVTH